MRLSLLLEYSGTPQHWLRTVPALEQAGLDVVWIPEAYSFDAVSLAGAMVQATTSVQVGTGIVNVYTRTASLLAMTAASLDQLSGGRFVLGLGASGPQVIEGFHGVPYERPVERIRDTIEICRRIWAREAPLEYEGKALTVPLPAGRGTGQGKPLKLVNHPLRPAIPVLWASMGPRAVTLTAELADGWMPMFYWPERAADTFGTDLAAGAARRASGLAPLDVVAGGLVAIDDPKAVADAELTARGMLALYVGGMGSRSTNFYHQIFSRYGYEAEADKIQSLFLSGAKLQAMQAVPAEIVHAVNLIGSREHVRERLEAYRAAGVTTFMAAGIVGDPLETVRTLRALIDG